MDIVRKRGDTYPDTLVVTSRKTKNVVNLTGCTFVMTLSSTPNPVDDSTQIYQITGLVPDVLTGEVEFAPTVEQANKVGYFYFDIQMTDSFGDITTLDSGTYTYIQDITK